MRECLEVVELTELYIELQAQIFFKLASRFQKSGLESAAQQGKQGSRQVSSSQLLMLFIPLDQFTMQIIIQLPLWQMRTLTLYSEIGFRNSLKVAKENSIQYIAFPAISCGAYGLHCYIRSLSQQLEHQHILLQRFCLKRSMMKRLQMFGHVG
ncbi:uncharacterized protein LOC130943294 isoform X2 [Arachis stenosperma]|uniref:uncharacterized protein LOC130943294 isoform X2 n=1 Tax=Arachis stenosperma TaxID=217475 RepID=UPI0025AB80DA|nr:uncharacterized protein LOC130943294 isoform X2 [Arachis stenosperma]